MLECDGKNTMAQIEINTGLVVTLKIEPKKIVLVPPWTESSANCSEFDSKQAIVSMPGTIPFDRIDWSLETAQLTKEQFVDAWVAFETRDDPEEIRQKPGYTNFVDRAKQRAENMYDTPGIVFEAS